MDMETFRRLLQKDETVGRRERWFISPNDVQLLPHLVLGRGGFGIAVAGAYFGSQVAVKIASRFRRDVNLQELSDSLNELQILRLGRHPDILVFTVQW